jgi:hypothetical protein
VSLSFAVSSSATSSSGESYATISEGSSEGGESAVGDDKPGMKCVASTGVGGETTVAGGRRSESDGAFGVDLNVELERADGGGTEGGSAITFTRSGTGRKTNLERYNRKRTILWRC